MWHTIAAAESIAAASTNADITFPTDGEITIRNDHLMLTEAFNLIGAVALGTGLTVPRLNAPLLNQIARHTFWPFNRSATIPSPVKFCDYRESPLPLPQNEEILFEAGNDDAGAQVQNLIAFISPPTRDRSIPGGKARVVLRATASVAGIAQNWSTEGNLTLAESIKGGWYSIINAHVFDAGSLAFRLVFPNPPLYAGRRMRPGGLCMEAIDNLPSPIQDGKTGVWGKFHSFELPRIQHFANATGASTQEIRLDCIYHGE